MDVDQSEIDRWIESALGAAGFGRLDLGSYESVDKIVRALTARAVARGLFLEILRPTGDAIEFRVSASRPSRLGYHRPYTGPAGAEIRALRNRLGLSQHALAQRLGTTVTTVYRWECGLRHPTGLYRRALEQLARDAT